MAIQDEHPEYINAKPEWAMLRACIAGQKAIHEAKETYLPRLSDQGEAEYKAYVARALFYGATSRTLDGLTGMIFRKPPMIELPQGLDDLMDNIDMNGLSLQGFSEQVVDDVVAVGRAGILVDHPQMPEGLTKAQAEVGNFRPFLKHYCAENIFNWKSEMVGNAMVLTQLRLWETRSVSDGEFDDETEKQIRVLDLFEGKYRQRVFIKKKDNDAKKEEWVQDLVIGDIIPQINGAPLDYIPFFFVGVKNGTPCVEKAPLTDMAYANISHYKTTADLEHGAHFTGLPTAVITGFADDADDPATFRIGSSTAWVFPSPDTSVDYLEFQGQGLSALKELLLKKEEYMAFLGARMLTPDKRGIESAETAQIHRAGETSILSSIAQSVSNSLMEALSVMAEWLGYDGEVKVELNRDFMAVALSAQDLQALLQTWQGGGMAYSDFLANLKRGEIIADDRTEDEIRSEIEQENPFDGGDIAFAQEDTTEDG